MYDGVSEAGLVLGCPFVLVEVCCLYDTVPYF